MGSCPQHSGPSGYARVLMGSLIVTFLLSCGGQPSGPDKSALTCLTLLILTVAGLVAFVYCMRQAAKGLREAAERSKAETARAMERRRAQWYAETRTALLAKGFEQVNEMSYEQLVAFVNERRRKQRQRTRDRRREQRQQTWAKMKGRLASLTKRDDEGKWPNEGAKRVLGWTAAAVTAAVAAAALVSISHRVE